MTGESKRRIAFYPLLYSSAFVLNFCWESWHGLLYHGHQELPASVYVPMMVQMALFDALSITGLQLFTALIARSLFWRVNRKSLAIFFLAGALPSWVVEYFAVYVLHLWSYTPDMPMLFRVGLSPVLQLPLTGIAAIVAARAVAGLDRSLT